MFSCKMQEFILEIFFREKMLKKEQKYYRSNIAFYRTVSYLKVAGMISTNKKEQYNEYSLTTKGKLFAIWLCGLPDNKFLVEQYEKSYGKNVDLEIAREM